MPTKSKFRKERCIYQYQSSMTGKWSFRVTCNGVDKRFNENDYLSASQAYKAAIDYRNSLLVGDKPKTYNVTVDDCYKKLNEIYVIRSETKRKLDCYYDKYINKKSVYIKDITMADVKMDLNAMVDTCSNDTIQRVLSIWKKIYGVAIANNYISKDITLQIKSPTSHKIRSNKRNELIDEQLIIELGNILKTRLISPLERLQAPYILECLYYTGMRPAELFALDKKDIDLKKKTISITKEMGSDRDNTNVVRSCKTEMSVRTIPISNKLYPIIEEAMKLNDSNILFPNSKGEHYATKDLEDKFHKIAKNKGIDFHFYQCRHTFITNLFMAGIDLKTIQELVGQTIDTTTIGYVVSSQERMQNAINFI